MAFRASALGAGSKGAWPFPENGKPDMERLAGGMARSVFCGGFQVGIADRNIQKGK